MKLLCETLLVTLSINQIVAARRTHFVYWNSTNPSFNVENPVIDVNVDNLPWEYDQLHLICPLNTPEQHVVYSVSEEEYNSCRVTSAKPKIVAICNKPHSFMYFTITFRSFSPTPGGLEFKPGQNYYFISTSTHRDIHRRFGGYCSSQNMKMMFRVADNRRQDSAQGVPAVPGLQGLHSGHSVHGGQRSQIDFELFDRRNIAQRPQYSRLWSVPKMTRNDIIYYKKPWHFRSQQQVNREILAQPFTSSSNVPQAFGSLLSLSAVLFFTFH